MATFTVFKTETCPWCVQAKGFLDALREARPDVEVRLVDANADPAAFRALVKATGRNTVPQILLDGRYLGGWSELAKAAGSGRLDAYMDGTEWEPPVEKPRLLARVFKKSGKKGEGSVPSSA